VSLLLTNIAELVTNDGDGAGGQPSGSRRPDFPDPA